MERLVLLLGAKGAVEASRPALYMVLIGPAARAWAFPAAHQLRARGLRVEIEGEEKSLKSQMRRADKLRARFALIVGDDELKSRKAILRDMDSKEQFEIDLERIEEEITARLTAED
jgi:histidyl-tRNA synthetase